MNDIDKRARELLAAEYERSGKRMAAEFASLGTSEHQPAINAIVAALSAAPQVPDSYSRSEQALGRLADQWRYQAATGGDGYDGPDYDQGVCETLLNCADELAAMLAAKPEPMA